MKRIVRLTESDLTRIVRRVISEQAAEPVLTYSNLKGLTFIATRKTNAEGQTYSRFDPDNIPFKNNSTGDAWVWKCSKKTLGASCDDPDCTKYRSTDITKTAEAFQGVNNGDVRDNVNRMNGLCASGKRF